MEDYGDDRVAPTKSACVLASAPANPRSGELVTYRRDCEAILAANGLAEQTKNEIMLILNLHLSSHLKIFCMFSSTVFEFSMSGPPRCLAKPCGASQFTVWFL